MHNSLAMIYLLFMQMVSVYEHFGINVSTGSNEVLGLYLEINVHKFGSDLLIFMQMVSV